jgi:hypothetical protein
MRPLGPNRCRCWIFSPADWTVRSGTPSAVLAAGRHADHLDQLLQGADGPVVAHDVVGEQEQAAGPRYLVHFGDRPVGVGDGAQREGAHHGVERLVGEGAPLRVAVAQVDAHVVVGGAPAGRSRAWPG